MAICSFRVQPLARVRACSTACPRFYRRLHSSASTSAQQPSEAVQVVTGESGSGAPSPSTSKYNWAFDKSDGTSAPREDGRRVLDLPVAAIRRPLGRTRSNDQEKVAALMESIQQIGLQEPIDVLEVDGVYYGFSGCHRYEAHQRLGAETIRCRVRKATKEVLKMHMM